MTITVIFLLHQDLISCVATLRYLPIGGLKEFNQVSVKLAYGDNSPAIQDARVAAVQSLSGTGSCRLMAEFMQRWMQGSKVCYLHLHPWCNDPTTDKASLSRIAKSMSSVW